MGTPSIDRNQLLEALARAGGSRSEAARVLGVSRATLYRWMRAHGIDEQIFRRIGDRYEVVDLLGEGDQGIVFLVRDRARQGALRALKMLRPDPEDPAARERLLQEFRRLALLEHPGLVRVYDFAVDERTGRPYLVMERVGGRPLPQAVRDRPLPFVLEAFRQVLEAVDHLHRQGLVHRDLKPENILVEEGDDPDRPGRVVVMDLGLSLERGTADAAPAGTLHFLAPEIFEGHAATPRSDLWSLGVVFYLALTDRLPWDAASARDLLETRRRTEPPPPSRWNPAVPLALDALVLGMLAEDPARRLPGAAAALARLAPLLGSDGIGVTGTTRRVPFVGRHEELEEAAAFLLGDTEGAPLLLVPGPEGIGRSRFVEAVADELRGRGARPAVGACRPGDEHPLAPFAPILREALEGADGSGDSHADEILRRYLPGFSRDLAGTLFGPGARAIASAEVVTGPAQVIDLLATILAEVAAHRPLAILIDDLHRADPIALDLAWNLARRGRRHPLRLLVTVRHPVRRAEVQAWLKGLEAERLARNMPLPALAPDAIRELASHVLGGARAAVLGETLDRTTGGNPRFLLEVLRSLAESPGEGLPGDLLLPGTLEAALEERLRRLPAAARRILEALAVRGRPTSREDLAAVAGPPDPASLETLFQGEWLHEGPGGVLELPGGPLRESLLRGLEEDRRRDLHAAWAERLAGREDVAARMERATHLLEAGAGKEARALFLETAEELVARWRYREATRFYQAALDRLPPDAPERLRIYPLLERAWHRAQDWQAAEGICRDWADLAARLGEPASQARALSQLAARLRQRHALGEAREVAARALELARAARDDRAIALAEKLVGGLALVSWDHTRAKEHLDRALVSFRRAGDARGEAICLQDFALVQVLEGSAGEALASFERADRIFGQLQDPVWQAMTLSNRGLVLTFLGHHDGAAECWRKMVERVRELGAAVPLVLPLENLALLLLRRGRYEEVLATARELVEEATRHGLQAYRISGLLCLGDAWARLDDAAAAREHHELALALAEAIQEEAQRRFALLARGRDELEARRLEDAETLFREVLEDSRRAGNLRTRALALLGLARVGLEAGEAERVHLFLAEAERALRVPREDGIAHLAELQLLRARAWQLDGRLDLAIAGTSLAYGFARFADALELQLEVLALWTALHDAMGHEDLAAVPLADAARLLRAAAARYEDPALRARFLNRPDVARLLDAALRRAAENRGAEEVARVTDTLAEIHEASERAASEGDPAPLWRRLVELAVERTGAERGLLVVEDEDGEFHPIAARGFPGEDGTVDPGVALRAISRTLLDEVHQGRTVLAVDAPNHPSLSRSSSAPVLGIRSVLAVPLRLRGRILGALYVDTRTHQALFSEADRRLLEALAHQAALALEHARLVEQLSAERDAYRQVAEETHSFGKLVGRSRPMREVFALLERVAGADLPVLILGESGTGKELAARAIHFNSRRKDRPFLSENCAAIPETLLESILFGHARGAFTGADSDHRGLFERANGGTLFLDEIGDMSPSLQAKLLRVLQEGEVRPVGAERTIKVDVRVVAATHRDLAAMVREGTFRQDLYYRLNGVTVRLPALRERKEDIPLLFRHFLERRAAEENRPVPEVDAAVLRALVLHDWPGNVRELENVVRRLLLFSDGDRIEARSLAAIPELAEALEGAGRTGTAGLPATGPARGSSGTADLGEIADEKERLRRALEATGGRKKDAAVLLGISRATLYRKLARHGLL